MGNQARTGGVGILLAEKWIDKDPCYKDLYQLTQWDWAAGSKVNSTTITNCSMWYLELTC